MFCASTFFYCRTNWVILLLTAFTWTTMPLVTGVVTVRSLVTNACETQSGIQTMRWPARSLDLKPVENAWSLLKRGMRRSIRLRDDLSRPEALLMRQEWERLGQEVINCLVKSMSSRNR